MNHMSKYRVIIARKSYIQSWGVELQISGQFVESGQNRWSIMSLLHLLKVPPLTFPHIMFKYTLPFSNTRHLQTGSMNIIRTWREEVYSVRFYYVSLVGYLTKAHVKVRLLRPSMTSQEEEKNVRSSHPLPQQKTHSYIIQLCLRSQIQFNPQHQRMGFKSPSADKRSAMSHGIQEALWVRVNRIVGKISLRTISYHVLFFFGCGVYKYCYLV